MIIYHLSKTLFFMFLIWYKELDKCFVVIHLKKVSKRERIEQTILSEFRKKEYNFIE